MRRLCALILAATTFACEPAEPIIPPDATPAPDRGAPLEDDALPPDATPPCPDADNDGVQSADCAPADQPADCDDTDPRIRPGATDPCGDGIDQDCDGLDRDCPAGCEPNPTITPCDALDDDCDGTTDECDPDRTCQSGRCLGNLGSPCADAEDCTGTLACADTTCTQIPPGGLCADDDQCSRDARCSRELACDPDLDRCYGLQGGRCITTCDCGAAWHCADAIARCATCFIDAHCDAPTRCTPAGLCATPITLGGDDTDARDQILAEILTCATTHRDREIAIGCRILDTAHLTIAGADVGALEPPTRDWLCPQGALTDRGFTPAEATALTDLFGCGDLPSRVHWTAPLPAERPAAACLTHLPPWVRPALGAPSIAIAPCTEVVYARE